MTGQILPVNPAHLSASAQSVLNISLKGRKSETLIILWRIGRRKSHPLLGHEMKAGPEPAIAATNTLVQLQGLFWKMASCCMF